LGIKASDIAAGASATAVGATTSPTGAAPATLDMSGATVTAGAGFSLAVSSSAGALAGADTAAENEIMYAARGGDTAADVTQGLVNAFNAHAAEKGIGGDIVATVDSTGTGITFTSSTGVAGDTLAVDANSYAAADVTVDPVTVQIISPKIIRLGPLFAGLFYEVGGSSSRNSLMRIARG